MKKDLDTLMKQRNLDALLVLGNAENNPPMYYFTGGGHVSGAALIKKRGQAPVLFCNDMERDEAAKSGLTIRLYSEYPFKELYQEAGGDMTKMIALRFQRMLTEFDLASARIGIYGQVEFSSTFAVLSELQRLLPDASFVGESAMDSVFLRAMETKDETEVERIRKMGAITTEVVALTAEYLTSCDVRDDEVLLKEDGTPLTISDMKAKINLWLAERGAVPSEGYIFAIGADAGVPHSQGNPDDLLRLGQTIVYDIYPSEQGGGYFFDFTRTWSLGYAAPEAQELYNQVFDVYNKVVENMDLNAPFKDCQALTCEEFEKYGHETPKNGKQPKEGYVHSLGHGLGLNVHERPFSGITAGDDERLAPGVVITVEPGLYYPSKGMGFRIEDTYWVRPDGEMERLAEYPYDFVLEMKKWKKN
ncbi:MAG: Xaa-Pro peptidase family protein [Anaerolineales bacterium]